MSRTYRKPHHWANAQLLDILNDLPRMNPKSQVKQMARMLKICRGQDGAIKTEVGEPDHNAPKGHHGYGPWAANAKRFAKRKTARIMRRRGSKEIKAQMLEKHLSEIEDAEEALRQELLDSWYDDEPMEKPDWEHEWYWAESRHDDFHDDDLSDHDMPNFDYLSSYEPNHYAGDMQRLRGLIVTYGTLGLREMLEIAEIQTGYKL